MESGSCCQFYCGDTYKWLISVQALESKCSLENECSIADELFAFVLILVHWCVSVVYSILCRNLEHFKNFSHRPVKVVMGPYVCHIVRQGCHTRERYGWIFEEVEHLDTLGVIDSPWVQLKCKVESKCPISMGLICSWYRFRVKSSCSRGVWRERESSEKEDVSLVLGLFYFPGRYKG